ncbi:MAG: hypothetical protein IKK43_05775 [Clostridia bacterium]|nr:hypothetical protein [Clostridia bacterium]
MKRNSKSFAKFMTVLFVLCVSMCQVAFAENSNQLTASEALACTRLTLTLIITVIGGIVICISLYKSKKNPKK